MHNPIWLRIIPSFFCFSQYHAVSKPHPQPLTSITSLHDQSERLAVILIRLTRPKESLTSHPRLDCTRGFPSSSTLPDNLIVIEYLSFKVCEVVYAETLGLEARLAIMEGYLTKKSHRFAQMQRRYCVLKGTMLLCYLTQDEYKSHIVPRKVLEVVDVHDRGHSSFEVEQLGGRTYFCTCTSDSNQAKWMNAMKEALEEPDRIAQEEIEEAQRFLFKEENDQREAVEQATEAIRMAQGFTQSVVEIDLETQEMKLLQAKVEETLQHTETLYRNSTQNGFKNALSTAEEHRNDRDALSLASPTSTRENTTKRLEEEFDLLTSVITFLTQKRQSLLNESQSHKENAAKSLTKAQSSRKSIEFHLQAWKSHQHETSEPESTQSLKPDRVFTSSHLDAIAEGYLLCKHPTKRSQMQRRYYVLFGNTLCCFQTADNFFALNMKRSSYRPLGLAHVESCEDWNGKLSSSKVVPHAFLIETTEGKTMYCSAPTRSIAENWKNALHISITMPSMSPHRALAARASRSSFDLSIPLQKMATQRSPKRSDPAVSTSQLAQSSRMEGYLLVHNEHSGRMEKKFFFITSLKLFVYESHVEYESSQLGRISDSKTPHTIQNVFFLEDHGLHVRAFLESYANGFILEVDTLKRIKCRAPNAREKENWVRVIQASLPLSNTVQPLKEIEVENTSTNEIQRQEENLTIDLDECEDVNGHEGELRWLKTEECEQWHFTMLSGRKLMQFDKHKTNLEIPLETLEIERVSETESDDLSRFIFHVHYCEAMNTIPNKLTLECRTLSEKKSWLKVLHLCLDVEVDNCPDDTKIDQSPGLLEVAKVEQAPDFSNALQITELEEASDLLKGSDDIEIEQSMRLLESSQTDQARGLSILQNGEIEEVSKHLERSDDIAIDPGQILSEYIKVEQVPGRLVVPYNSKGEEDPEHRIGSDHADITKHIETDSELFRSFLVRFYETYNPSKISSLDELIAHCSGKDGKTQLLRQLDAVYGTTVSSDPEVLSLIKEMSPSVDPTKLTVLIEGYLLKRGHRIPSMRKRYFVLQSVNETLRYFETKEDADSFQYGLKALGEFQIGNVCDWNGRTLTQTYKNGMQVEACDGRVYFCAASSENERESWIRAFHHAIVSREALCEAPESLFSPLRQKLFNFYERVNPSKLCDLDLLLHCYKGREPALLEAIDVHYGTSITGDPEWRQVLPDLSCGDARLANALDTLSYKGQVLRASKSPATGALALIEVNHLYEKTASVFAVVCGITLKLYTCRAQWKDGSKANSILTILSVKDIVEDNESDFFGRFAIEAADHTWVFLQAADQEEKAVWVKVIHAAIDAVFGQSILAEEQQSRLDTLENIVWVESNVSFEKKLLVLTGNKLCVGTDSEESILVVQGISAWEADFEDSKLPVKYPFQIEVQGGVKLRCLVENDVIRAHWIRTIRRNAKKPEDRPQISSVHPSSELDIATCQGSMGPLLAWKRLKPDLLPTMVYAALRENHLQLKVAGTFDSQLFLEGFIVEMKAWEPVVPGEISGGVQVDLHVNLDAEHLETVFLSFSSTQVMNHWYQAFPKVNLFPAVETTSNILKMTGVDSNAEHSQRIPNRVLEGYLEIQSTRDSHWHYNMSHKRVWKKYYIVLETRTEKSFVRWLMYATQNEAVVSLTGSASKRETDGPLQVYNVFGFSETESKEWSCFEVMYRMNENETGVLHCRTRAAKDRVRWLDGIREAINMCESFCGRQKESSEIRSRLQSLEQDARRQSILIRESLQAALEAISDSESSEDSKSLKGSHYEDDEACQNVCILDPETPPMHTEGKVSKRENVTAPHPDKNVSYWSGWSHTLAEFFSQTFTCLTGSDQNGAMCHVYFPDTNCHFIADITGVSDHPKCGKLYTCDYFSQDA
uniref:Uncharacterized protein AlNc14C62G4490 n=1 Tax=Albugo laibachii Nc14 TaxID=890382 RepID=F0WCW2_9STRA|nr:conserved hypothetical protein [Albugo laibachii Nc14]|eukprot:CCA19033.1 conserved hypothetical protein [Albugo laibachii Nc14]